MVIMAQNIKQKPGYKRTEVGMIPEDWQVKLLGEIASVSSGGTPDRLNSAYWGGDVPWITTTQINFNSIDKANEFITRKGLENSAARVYNPGTLLMAMYGQGKTRGKVAILAISAAINQACAAIQLSKGVSNEYVFFNLSARYEEIRSLSNTGNQENLNAAIIKSILLPLPKEEKEQHAIVAALSDIDALITSLDKLIAKKRDIKQATMQQLLTGKRRLPGFSGAQVGYKQTEVGMIPEDWEVKKLSEVCSYQNGTALEKYFNEIQGLNVISIGNYSVDGKYIDTNSYIDRKHHKKIQKFILHPNELCMILNDKTSIGTIIGRALLIEEDDKYVFNQRSMRITPYKGFYAHYFYYIINSNLLHDRIISLAKPGTQIYVNTGDVTGLEIPIPKSLEEQTAIATVLSDMDAEIAALEQKRDKTRALKQAMMQELLTGKTRLV